MNYLLSYNHSGNTWVRYATEFLTRRPTYGHKKHTISDRDNNFLAIWPTADVAFIKRHTVEEPYYSDDILILLLRNPSDCIKHDQDVEKEFLKYYSLIFEFERFTGKKLLVYYDDITSEDWQTCYHWLTRILVNFRLLKSVHHIRLDQFKEKFHWHQNQSKKIYANERHKEGATIRNWIPDNLLEHEYLNRFIIK